MKIDGLLFGKLNEEFEDFERKLTKGTSETKNEDNIQEIIKLYEERILSDSLKKLSEHYPFIIEAQIKNQEFISNNLKTSFSYFFAYLNSVNQVYENIRKYLNKNKLEDKNKLIVPQYGNLIRLADEIGVMLLNGYPDGAWRIWRSFYEYTAVLLLFIKERHRDDLVTKYIDHFYRSKRKRAASMQKNYLELKFPPFDENFLLGLHKKAGEFNELYGKEFLDDEYGWCSDIFNVPHRVTLRDIEEFVGINRFRPFYIWASEYCHPGFGSMLDFFDDDKKKLNLFRITKQSLRKNSFIDPMQFTISLFHEVNLEFLKVYSSEREYEINMLMFRRIFEALIKSFD